MVLFAEEQYVDSLANQVDVEVELDCARSMIAFGEYALHTGLREGTHYRKERGTGCYHLRIAGERAFLHWDRWDPRRFPVEHFFESPSLWLPALGLVLVASLSVSSRT